MERHGRAVSFPLHLYAPRPRPCAAPARRTTVVPWRKRRPLRQARASATTSAGSASSPTSPCARWPQQSGISAAVLKEIEAGLRNPSRTIVQSIAGALRLSAETLYLQAGVLDPQDTEEIGTVHEIRRDPSLTQRQRDVLDRDLRSVLRRQSLAGGVKNHRSLSFPRILKRRIHSPYAGSPAGGLRA